MGEMTDAAVVGVIHNPKEVLGKGPEVMRC
jgi:hypothetical protein